MILCHPTALFLPFLYIELKQGQYFIENFKKYGVFSPIQIRCLKIQFKKRAGTISTEFQQLYDFFTIGNSIYRYFYQPI